jgi:GMP synthase (glutamine-hydrolysing)
MKRLLVCQHVAFEILGTLDPLLRDAGLRIRYVNFARHPDAQPCLDRYHGMVVLGGPMNADQIERHPHLATELRLIERAIEREIPILGICLGAQLIAKALGAKVKRSPHKEIGWYDVALTEEGRRDPVLAHFRKVEKVFQWHGDTFDVPQKAELLAVSPSCRNQAFRFGPNVYGLQFHLEVDEPLIARWLTVPVHREELEELKGRIDPDRIRSETTAYIGRLKRLSDQTFGEFITLFGERRRRRALPSR